MKNLGTKTLESERLILRRFTMEDATAMFVNWANDAQVTKYLTWPTHESTETSKAVLGEWISQYKKDDYYQWAITVKANGDIPIGSIGVVRQNPDAQLVEVGYCIGQKWWHMGITFEALSMLLAFFFEEVGLNRVEARHDPHNPNSGRVMSKCGLKHEGTMRQAGFSNQGICDWEIYAILAKDYFGAKEQHG